MLQYLGKKTTVGLPKPAKPGDLSSAASILSNNLPLLALPPSSTAEAPRGLPPPPISKEDETRLIAKSLRLNPSRFNLTAFALLVLGSVFIITILLPL